jgi:magnesium transporter
MLINCVAYRDGVRLADIDPGAISDHLGQPGSLVWVALRDATDAELDEMRREFGLHELAVEDARHGHQRPKIEEYADTLFVVMHTLEIVHGEVVLGEVHVFVGRDFLLSVRNRSSQHFLGVRERCEQEPHLLRQGPSFVLYALMDTVVDRYFPVLDAFESEFEAIEEQIFERGQVQSNIKRLYELKRKVVQLKHAVTPLMEAVGKLHGGRVPALCANTQEYFRDVHDHLARINTSADSLREAINTAILVCQSTISIEQNNINKRLAAWAAIFAITTAFAGIWGMNFEFMPELGWQYGYPVALLAMLAVAGVMYRGFRRSGWL